MKKYSTNDYSDTYTRNLIRGNVTGNLGITSAMRFSAIYGEGVDRLSILRTLQKENTFRFWWYLIFWTLAIVCLIWQPSSYLSVMETFIIMVNIDLVARGKVAGIYIGIVDCIFYIVIAYLSGLWGEIIKMALINIPLNIVAIVSWTKNLKKQETKQYQPASIQIQRLNVKTTLLSVGLFIASAVVSFFILNHFTNSAITTVIISSASLAIGILSKVLNGQRYMEAYIISVVGNIIGLVLWINTIILSVEAGALNANAVAQIIIYLASLTNNLYGFFLWKSIYRKATVNGGKILVKRRVKINRVIKLRRMYKNLHWNKKVDITKNS